MKKSQAFLITIILNLVLFLGIYTLTYKPKKDKFENLHQVSIVSLKNKPQTRKIEKKVIPPPKKNKPRKIPLKMKSISITKEQQADLSLKLLDTTGNQQIKGILIIDPKKKLFERSSAFCWAPSLRNIKHSSMKM